MPWDERQISRTLLIQRHGRPNNYFYKLHSFWRLRFPDGTTYMQPVPAGDISLPHMGFTFDAIEFLEPPTAGYLGDGDTQQTHDNPDMVLRATDRDA